MTVKTDKPVALNLNYKIILIILRQIQQIKIYMLLKEITFHVSLYILTK